MQFIYYKKYYYKYISTLLETIQCTVTRTPPRLRPWWCLDAGPRPWHCLWPLPGLGWSSWPKGRYRTTGTVNRTIYGAWCRHPCSSRAGRAQSRRTRWWWALWSRSTPSPVTPSFPSSWTGRRPWLCSWPLTARTAIWARVWCGPGCCRRTRTVPRRRSSRCTGSSAEDIAGSRRNPVATWYADWAPSLPNVCLRKRRYIHNGLKQKVKL